MEFCQAETLTFWTKRGKMSMDYSKSNSLLWHSQSQQTDKRENRRARQAGVGARRGGWRKEITVKLLKFVKDGEIDQVLMVVPDDYNEELAEAEATDMLGEDTYLEWTGILDLTTSDWDAPSTYRPYIG